MQRVFSNDICGHKLDESLVVGCRELCVADPVVDSGSTECQLVIC